MLLIATGNPSAKLDESGEAIQLRIPSGKRESVTLELTLNQCIRLRYDLQLATEQFFEARKAAADWRAENVIAFPRQ
jgi:hypothetical protein